jgi:SAM-dependent methyltransferase
MTDLAGQIAYWNTAGATKVFTHPLDHHWLGGVDRRARVVDYGCGYGRLTAELAQAGFSDVIGVDVSQTLISRARQQYPALHFDVLTDPPKLNERADSVDVILLFAVLTCVPSDDDQRQLIDELARVLRPGGLLYLSDLTLASDDRNRHRYAQYGGPLPYGTFTTDDSAICRHHDPGRLRSLLAGFDLVREQTLTVATMNGNQAPAMQILARRKAD